MSGCGNRLLRRGDFGILRGQVLLFRLLLLHPLLPLFRGRLSALVPGGSSGEQGTVLHPQKGRGDFRGGGMIRVRDEGRAEGVGIGGGILPPFGVRKGRGGAPDVLGGPAVGFDDLLPGRFRPGGRASFEDSRQISTPLAHPHLIGLRRTDVHRHEGGGIRLFRGGPRSG